MYRQSPIFSSVTKNDILANFMQILILLYQRWYLSDFLELTNLIPLAGSPTRPPSCQAPQQPTMYAPVCRLTM